MSLRFLALPALLLAAAPAFAQVASPPAADPGGDFAVVGVGAGILPDYEGSDDYRWSPVPGAAGRVAGFNFQLAGNRASVDLIPDSAGPGWDFQAGPVAVVNFNRSSVKSIDDSRVKALGELNTAIELGGYVGIARTGVITSDYDRLSVSLTYRHDVNNAHDSAIWSPSVSYATPLSTKSLVTMFVSAERVENGYADAYFGVTPAQAVVSGLPAYNPEGGWKSWTAGLGGMVSLTGDLRGGLQLVGGATYKRLVNDFGQSPVTRIAGDRDQWMGVVGLAFAF